MRKAEVAPPPVSSPLDDVRAGLESRDPVSLDAAFTADATVVVRGMDGWSWSDAVSRQAAWAQLFAAVPDAAYTAERRYVSPGTHAEEGVLTGTVSRAEADGSQGESFTISLRLVADLDADRVRGLEVSGDTTALPLSLRPSVSGAAAAVSSMFALRHTQPPQQIKVLAGPGRSADEAPCPAPPDEAGPADAPAPAAHGRRRRVLLAAAAVAVLATAAGVVVATSGPRPSARTAPGASEAAAQPVQPEEPSPSPESVGAALPAIEDDAASAPPTVQAGEQLVLRSDVLFATGSASLSESATSALAELARSIRERNISGTVQVNGYTDSTGTDELDLDLSRQRALAVAQVLQRDLSGVPVTLQPQGFGKADPIADNATEQGRAQNRRVTIILPAVP